MGIGPYEYMRFLRCVGVDAHIDPMGTIEFAADHRVSDLHFAGRKPRPPYNALAGPSQMGRSFFYTPA